MWKKDKQEAMADAIEQSVVEVKKKKTLGLLKKKENDIVVTLDQRKVKEKDGPFKHRVTGQEFNMLVVETQNALIQMKQEMLSFNGRVDGIGHDLNDVDRRHNKASENTVKTVEKIYSDLELKHEKELRVYKVITIVAALIALASLIILIVSLVYRSI